MKKPAVLMAATAVVTLGLGATVSATTPATTPASPASPTGDTMVAMTPADAVATFDANGDGKVVIGIATAGPADDGAYYQALVDKTKEVSTTYGFGDPIVVDKIKSDAAATELENLAQQGVDMILVGASSLAAPLAFNSRPVAYPAV